MKGGTSSRGKSSRKTRLSGNRAPSAAPTDANAGNPSRSIDANTPAASSEINSASGVADNFITGLTLAKGTAKMVPILGSTLEGACEIALVILEAIQLCEDNQEEWAKLGGAVAQTSNIVDSMRRSPSICSDSEIQGLVESYERKLKEVRTQCLKNIPPTTLDPNEKPGTFTKVWQGLKSKTKKLALRRISAGEIAGHRSDLQSKYEDLILGLQRVNNEGVHEGGHKLDKILGHDDQRCISGLKTAAEANGDIHQRCMADTRVDIREEVTQWATDETSPQICLIADAAGTGKSTIANDLAYQWKKEGKLIGRFFFSRNYETTRTHKYFFSTLAQQGLAHISPAVASKLVEGIRRLSDPVSTLLEQQCEEIFVKPLQEVQDLKVLVLDAIDECEKSEKLLKLILGYASSLRNVKFFITSRPEQPMITVFAQFPHLRKDLGQNARDVSLFLQRELSPSMSGRSRLNDEQVALLIQRSNGLFIWASTVARLVTSMVSEPEEIMEQIMSPENDDLDELYTVVLNQVEKKDFATVGRVLEIIMAAYEPLTPAAIDNLLQRFYSYDTVLKLASVLQCNGPEEKVRFLHPTFRDYLLRSTKINIKQRTAHLHLAGYCLSFMMDQLHYDLCGLGNSSMKKRASKEAKLAKARISPLLTYTCRWWGSHVAETFAERHSDDSHLEDIILSFLKSRFLDWLYTLSILDLLHEGSLMMSGLDSDRIGEELRRWILDAGHFIQSGFQELKSHPLAAYHQFLVNSPRESLISTEYTGRGDFPHPQVTIGKPLHWAQNRAIDLPRTTSTLSISPCGTWIVSGYKNNGKIGIWTKQTATGIELTHCRHKSCGILHASFHDHCSKLKTACNYGSICWWDITALRDSQKASSVYVISDVELMATWSADGSRACFTNKISGLCLYEANHDTVTPFSDICDFPEDLDGCKEFSFSPYGQFLFIGSQSRIPVLVDCSNKVCYQFDPEYHGFDQFRWSTRESKGLLFNESQMTFFAVGCNLQQLWMAHNGLSDVQFLPEGDKILGLTSIGGFVVYRASDGAILVKFLAGEATARFCIAPNGHHFALAHAKGIKWVKCDSGEIDRDIVLAINIKKGIKYRGLDITPDSETIIAAIGNGSKNSLEIWSTEQKQPQELEDENLSEIRIMTFSPHGQLFAAADSENRVRIWDSISGRFLGDYTANGEVLTLEISEGAQLLLIKTEVRASVIDFDPRSDSNLVCSQQFDRIKAKAAALFPISRRIAVSTPGTIAIIDIDPQPGTGTRIISLPLLKSGKQVAISLAISPDENMIAAVVNSVPHFHWKGEIRIYAYSLHGENLEINTCAFMLEHPQIHQDEHEMKLRFLPDSHHLMILEEWSGMRGASRLAVWNLDEKCREFEQERKHYMLPVSYSSNRLINFLAEGTLTPFRLYQEEPYPITDKKPAPCKKLMVYDIHQRALRDFGIPDQPFLYFSGNEIFYGDKKVFDVPSELQGRLQCVSGNYVALAGLGGKMMVMNCLGLMKCKGHLIPSLLY